MVTREQLLELIRPRRLKDWMQLGLVDSPVERRGRRSDGGRGTEVLWRDGQDILLTDLLALHPDARERPLMVVAGEPVYARGIRDLADHVVGRWLLVDPTTPDRQALRALRSWSWPERIGSRRISRQLARELLAGFPPRARAALFQRLAEALESRRPLDADGTIKVPYEKLPRVTREQVVDGETLRLALEEQREKRLDGERVDELERRMRVYVEETLRTRPEAIGPKVGEPTAESSAVSPWLVVDLVSITRALARLDDVGELELRLARQSIVPLLGSRPRHPLPGAAPALLRELGKQDRPQPR